MSVKRLKFDFHEAIKFGHQKEKTVGVTEFIGSGKPFFGTIKHL